MILTLENQIYLPYDQILGIFDFKVFGENEGNQKFYQEVRSNGRVVHSAKGDVKTLVLVEKEIGSGNSEITIYESSIASMTLYHRINRV